MTTENPFKEGLVTNRPNEAEPQHSLTGEEAYHLVSDTVTGLNVRKSDNKFQAVFIFVAVLLLAAIGAALAAFIEKWEMPWYGGALMGGFAGLVFGVLASGVCLMVYRAVKHMQGDHE